MKFTFLLPDGRYLGRPAFHSPVEPVDEPKRAIVLTSDGARLLEPSIRLKFPDAIPVPHPHHPGPCLPAPKEIMSDSF